MGKKRWSARKISCPENHDGPDAFDNPNPNVADVCDTLHVSRATLYRHLEKSAGK
jgi:hypothetical protein